MFGLVAAQGAIVAQLSGLMGPKTAEALQAMIESANKPGEGFWASLVGLGVVVVAATGVFGEASTPSTPSGRSGRADLLLGA